MAILHCNWLLKNQNGCLFIWGETWRSPRVNSESNGSGDIAVHPLAMTSVELSEWLHSQNMAITNFIQKPQVAIATTGRASKGGATLTRKAASAPEISLPTHSQIIALPTYIEGSDKGTTAIFPVHSASLGENTDSPQYLQPWRVEGFCLNPSEAVKFLAAVPLSAAKGEDAFLGGDLRFWSQVARWSLDLISRCKFLPTIDRESNGAFAAKWQVLLDSAVDGTRLEKFSATMPLVCRTYQEGLGNGDWGLGTGEEFSQSPIPNPQSLSYVNFPTEPQKLLLGFLNSTIDAQVREMVGSQPASLPGGVRQWLQALTSASHTVNADAIEVERLEAALKAWTMPLQSQLTLKTLFRTCFQLRSPESGETDWTLAYFLQAADDPEFVVDAATIWNNPVERLVYQNRTIDQPQETFLRGLGVASRLYPAIAPSFETEYPQYSRITPIQAYEFIKAVAWRLEDSGLGVILPPSLANREGWANRLGLKITAETPKGKQGRLGLQSLLNFQWQLAIGGQTISKAEFDKLVALNSPLVEINGEWVELRPQDIKTAQTFFTTRKDQMALSLEDALRLSTGDTQAIEKLPVVSFDASGALQELIGALNNNQAIAPLPTPTGFKGQLRPYQERGAAWLSFLERWGLGACLADDMGLGKCVANDTLVNVNGLLRTAETIWKTHAGETEFDGEGFWTNPTEELIVNSIDETTGKIVPANVRRLYRQQVSEKLRKITLQDGNSITITHRHKLLTSKGWTNNLQVGDYVCVPGKTLWNGKPQDHDLVKFLAWQIAEGHELPDVGRVTISQKDTRVLEDLLQTCQRIQKRYNLKINSPNISTFPNRVASLRVNSQAYRKFLEAKGYVWGKLSAEKSIPPFIMQADLDSVRIFLQNYFDAESAVLFSMRSIEISTASALLIQQLSALLRRFGIWLRISPKLKCATNGTRTFRTYYIGVIEGNSARRFLQEIGFNNSKKQSKLEQICQLVSNTNIEGIPASDMVAQTVIATGLPLRHFGMHNTVYINGSQQFFRDSLQRVIAGMNRMISGEAQEQYQLLKPSKWTTQTLSAYSNLDVEELSLTRQSLQCLLDQEVFYCRIESIEEIDYEGWVYDFEVSKHHNFVANNIICHNTVQFIAFLLHLKEQDALENPTLLVCPTSVLGNWEREVNKFA
ncbi:MAG: SNF2 helicase-associated domain-containing protein, partial [Nostoc sp.]|uniref:SNF2 helicase-associated domain-containing protein n=1 Tax=Nostoc sp. TaxID=1180 RepID=UPI002FFC1F69